MATCGVVWGSIIIESHLGFAKMRNELDEVSRKLGEMKADTGYIVHKINEKDKNK
jgi:hypothetical protein